MIGIEPTSSPTPRERSTDDLHPETCCILPSALIEYYSMKLICLNLWGGKKFKPLIEFIKGQSKDTDIFCFQEVFKTNSGIIESHGFRLNFYDEISKILPDFQSFFAPCVDNYIAGAFLPKFEDFNLSWGLAIFIHKKFQVTSDGDFFVFGGKNTFDPKDLNSLPRNIQYITITDQGKKFIICNLHGIWRKGEKIDYSSRIIQSEKINNFLDQFTNEAKILCGDFNLNINTKSLKILEKNMENLIRKYNIPTTRSKLYTWGDKYADYTLVSSNIKVLNFEVSNIEVSDHLPMILEFD